MISSIYIILPVLLAHGGAPRAFVGLIDSISATLWIAGFLCILNIGLAFMFRKRRAGEVVSYYTACTVELAIFIFAFVLHLGLISHVPYHLPPGLPFNRAEIGATIAVGIGLFPAAYWHRTPVYELRKRIAQDAKVMKDRDGGVHVHKSAPNEWMN